MRVAAIATLALVLLAGCSGPEPDGPGEVGHGPHSFDIFVRHVDGYGLCTFAWGKSGYGGGLTLIGCDGRTAGAP